MKEVEKESVTITLDKELKQILEEEAKNLGYSTSRYIELLLRERDIQSMIKKMADSIGVSTL